MVIDEIKSKYNFELLEPDSKHVERLNNIEYKAYMLITSMDFAIYYSDRYGYVLVDTDRNNEVYNTFYEEGELDPHSICVDNIREFYEIIPENYFLDYEYSLEKVYDDNFINLDRKSETYTSFYEMKDTKNVLSNFTIIKEIKHDLIDAIENSEDFDVYIAHCIGADYMMAAGIAYVLDSRYDIRSQIKTHGNELVYPNVYETIHKRTKSGNKLHIFNLVTKQRSHNIPNYENFISSLIKLNKELEENDIQKLMIPRIGCGIDRMDWNKVKCYIYKYITYPENILVYYL